MYYTDVSKTSISLEWEVTRMKIHFAQDLKLNHSKKEIISNLICQRIHLLIGSRKASCIEDIFFGNSPPGNAISLSYPASGEYLTKQISLCMNNGKATLYCTPQMLYSLIRPQGEQSGFDDAMTAVSKALPISS